MTISLQAGESATVEVEAQTNIVWNHAQGTLDVANFVLATAPSSCVFERAWDASVSASADAPSDGSLVEGTLHQRKVFQAMGPGSFTYYLNVKMDAGASTGDRTNGLNLVARTYVD